MTIIRYGKQYRKALFVPENKLWKIGVMLTDFDEDAAEAGETEYLHREMGLSAVSEGR